ncbi:serine/threonine-protein kinase [Micromonospora peucetia]|uniref:non-specific serine/threonine protein kinase n=1 Tax=Micromonospora peucetia TaxID=47871 RepID=A0A1C6VET0_9ACTN|nr:serine/threonine-protein kinase [Micromonospora peucetia]WSA30186.1 protein kinase [Micromonospora peucetia]SCL64765.1 serine/threonine protein kinase [Micromonospora peucetia]
MKAALHPGRLLARRYRLIDQIGAGGMSVIWRARDEVLDRVVALKVLAPSLAADARFRDMVREEARAAAQLVHPHVTSVHDYGETVAPDGSITSFVVMELLAGEELEVRLTEGPLPWTEAVEVGVQVADALAAAHRLGIVHRDITPANVMMTRAGVKVLDFGIATRIGAPDDDEDGGTFGTPAYVAPERLDGAPAQPSTDVYSLGVLLYEALTGRVPYPADTWEQLGEALAGDGPPPLTELPGLPPEVARTCLRCLARDPLERPTARQVATVLRDQLLPADPQAATMLAPTVTLPTLPAPTTDPMPATDPVPTTGPVPTTNPALAFADAGGPGGTAGPGTGGPGRTAEPGTGGTAAPSGGSESRSARLARQRRRRRLPRPLLIVPVVLIVGVALAVPAIRQEETSPPRSLPTPGPSELPATPTATAETAPTPAAAPTPTSATPVAPPPTRTPPERGDLIEAANRIDGLIGAGLDDGGIRPDVGLDFRNELRNLTDAARARSGDLGERITQLREKVAVRRGEGAITDAYARRLDSAITALGTARA